MLDETLYESLLLEDLGCSAPTDQELRRILFRALEGRNPERNELIFFMQLNSFRISETAQVTVEHCMWPDGAWKDIVTFPAKICKNGQANKILFVNKRLREVADNYVNLRIAKKQKLSGVPEYRGLIPHLPLILAEGNKGYSLKKKIRYDVDGNELIYLAADTLQNTWSGWCKKAGLDSKFSSHCGRKAFASRLAWNSITGDPKVIATLIRHSDLEMPFKYIKESGKVGKSICELYESIGSGS